MTHATRHTDSADCSRPPIWAWAGAIFGLLWIAVPVVEFAGADPSQAQVALVAAGLLVFAPSFLVAAMTQRSPLVPAAVMSAVAVALTLGAADDFALLFVWAASAAAVRLSGPANVVAVSAITALAAFTLALTSPDGGLFWGLTGTVLATGTLWLLIGGLLRSNAALRDARAELAERAVAEERLRFARDLHDLLGRDLSLIAIKSELAGKLLPAGADRASAEIDDIRALTRGTLAQLREAVGGYRRPTLPGELAGARVALEAAGIELRVDGPSAPLDPAVESVLAWAVREGAVNAIRHSGARHAEITVRPGVTATVLEIADDGHGAPGADDAGHGLTGLRERVRAIGGTVEAGGAPGGGFRLLVSVPDQTDAAAA